MLYPADKMEDILDGYALCRYLQLYGKRLAAMSQGNKNMDSLSCVLQINIRHHKVSVEEFNESM